MNLILMRWAALAAAALSLFLGYSAWGLHQVITAKVQEQQAINLKLATFKRSYDRLLPVRTQWQKAYPTLGRIDDLVGLYRALDLGRYGFTTYEDDLTFAGGTPQQQNGVDLHLTSECLGNGGTGLHLSADTPRQLVDGLTQLLADPSVRINAVSLSSTAPPRVDARLDGFCILRRALAKGEPYG